MSKYTTEVRYICEKANNLENSVGYQDVDDIINGAIPKVFSFSFPIFDEEYRNVLCAKILRHYYTREIGFETVALWKLKLQTKLNEIMPFYNQLYKSELIKFNPLYDTDLQTTNVADKNTEQTSEENKTGLSSGSREKIESGSNKAAFDTIENNKSTGSSATDSVNSNVAASRNNAERDKSETGNTVSDRTTADNSSETANNTHYDLYSDTPQGALTGVDNENYLTNARKITDNNTKSLNHNGADVGEENYNRSADESETGSIESTAFNNENTNNTFEETNNKTNISNENRTNSASANETDQRTDTENRTGKDKITSTESYALHVIGKNAGISFSKMLTEFRETFLNIDLDIIENLSDLFINLW